MISFVKEEDKGERTTRLTCSETGSSTPCPPTPKISVQHTRSCQLESEEQRLLELVVHSSSLDSSLKSLGEGGVGVVGFEEAEGEKQNAEG